jgi:Ice-binding-like
MKHLTLFALVAACALVASMTLAGSALAVSPLTVDLGTAGNFAVFASTGITDVPSSVITGDVGVDPSPGSTIGLGCLEVTGTIYSVDATGPLCRVTDLGLLTTAKSDLGAAYGDAATRVPDAVLPGADNQLGTASSLVAGVYRFGHATTANLTGNLTLTGSASDVWIFQATTDLVTAAGSSITFSGGAQPCNVYWQVGTLATLNGNSFAGTVMSGTSITSDGGLVLTGRALAGTGNVTLIQDTIARPTCAAAPAAPAAPVSTPAPTPAPDRALYCDATGKTYDLVAGQDKQPPYDALGLVPAYVDAAGSKSCNFPTAATPPATTPTPTTPTPVTPTPTPAKPLKPPMTPAAKAAAAKRAAAKLAATKLAAAKVKASRHGGSTTRTHARTARHRFALTG